MLEALARGRRPATFFLVGEQVERRPGARGARSPPPGMDRAARPSPPQPAAARPATLRRRPRPRHRDDRGRARAGAAPLPPAVRDLQPAGAGDRRAGGLQPLLWSRWGHDWRARRPPERIAAEVTADLARGRRVAAPRRRPLQRARLWRRTVAALPRILERIAAAGLRPVARLSQLTVSAVGVLSLGASGAPRAPTTRATPTAPMTLSRIVARWGMPRSTMSSGPGQGQRERHSRRSPARDHAPRPGGGRGARAAGSSAARIAMTQVIATSAALAGCRSRPT